MRKLLIPLLVLIAMTACATDETATARENVENAEDELMNAKEEAAKGVADAKAEGAAHVDAAKADLEEAKAELQVRFDEVDADIAELEASATTPEQKDEIVLIRERQNSIVVKVRDHDENGISWSEIQHEVDQALNALGTDIDNTRVKITEKK